MKKEKGGDIEEIIKTLTIYIMILALSIIVFLSISYPITSSTIKNTYASLFNPITSAVSFQQFNISFKEDSSFINTTDETYISANNPTTNYGSTTSIKIDGVDQHAHGLIKFPNIFGNNIGQIPLGSNIISATLTLSCTNIGNNMDVYLLKEDWTENQASWNNRKTGIPWSNVGADGTSSHYSQTSVWICANPTGLKTYDVKSFVQNWSNGLPNYGIVIKDTGTDGIDFSSSESANKPLLKVTYETSSNGNIPPIANAGPDQTLIDSNNDNIEQITLNGSLSNDPDGTISSYEWKENSNILGTIQIIITNLSLGVHLITLTVTDNNNTSTNDTVTITINQNTTQSNQTFGNSTSPNFKVAFIADTGTGPNAEAVLNLIKNEGADMVIHSGDLGYGGVDENNVQTAINWNNQINNILGSNFPYFASIGNHDVGLWNVAGGYSDLLESRLSRINGSSCTGNYGKNSACKYNGLFFILGGGGDSGTETTNANYIRTELAQDDSVWSVCSWHKNQIAMRVGAITDEVGWSLYEECQKAGAIIATAHDHSYARTKTLTNMQTQTVDPQWPNASNVRVAPNSTFVFVSGLGGRSIRPQLRCGPETPPYGCNQEWASIYTTNQSADFGALFCTFNVNNNPNKAECYFKDINGNIPDQFDIISQVNTAQNTSNNETNSSSPSQNSPPQSILNSPLNNATNVPLNPILNITAIDTDTNNLNITFFGRDGSANTTAQNESNWTIIALGDIQNSVEFFPKVMDNMTQWIADNKNTLNIKFVVQGGDIVNSGGNISQWNNANKSFNILDNDNVPFAIIPGNHDWQNRTYVNFNKYFGINRFQNRPWWGGSVTPTSNHANYMLFSVAGQDFIIVSWGYHPNQSDFDWANQVLQANSDRKAIINTDGYLEANGNYFDSNAQQMWDDIISQHSNTFAVFSTSLNEEYYRANPNIGGNIVHQFAANYQGRAKNKGEGWFRIYTFDPKADKIYVKTYEVTKNIYETDANSQFNVNLDFDLQPPTSNFQTLTTLTNIPSNSNVIYQWSNRSLNKTYQWYATVTDGINQTTSKIWRFTTQTSPDQPDTIPPIISLISPLNGQSLTSAIQSFNASFTDNIDLDNSTFNLWNSSKDLINQTSLPITSASDSASLTVTLPYEDEFSWNYQATDSSNNKAFAANNFTLIYDITAPLISIIYPSNTTYNNDITELNYTISDSNLNRCWYSLNQGITNTTITCGNNITGISSSNGINILNIYANDSAGNNNLASVTFVIDDISPPLVSINAPKNITYTTSTINFNITLNENGSVIYTLDSGLTNITMSSSNNREYTADNTLADGSYTFQVYANDTSGNKNDTESITFSVDTSIPPDTIPPQVTINSPKNITYINSTINFNVTLNENGSVQYSLDNDLTNITMTTTDNKKFTAVNTLADGSYKFRAYANDSAGNKNYTESVIFSINTSPPTPTNDIIALADAQTNLDYFQGPRTLVWLNTTKGYLFYMDNTNDGAWAITTNAGQTWTKQTDFDSLDARMIEVWYDKWTPGNNGSLIHIAWIARNTDDVEYAALNTITDTLSGTVTVFNGASDNAVNLFAGFLSITKARGGNLYIAGRIDPDGENHFSRSVNGGSSWTTRTNVWEGIEDDQLMLAPGNQTNPNDILAVFLDASTNELSLKTYNDNANSWTEKLIIKPVDESTNRYMFDIVTRHSDNHTLIAAWQNGNDNNAGQNLTFWDVGDKNTITKKTNLFTSASSTIFGIGMMINQQNNNIYVAYLNGTTTSSNKPYYKSSTNGGASWSNEISLAINNASNNQLVISGTSIGKNGGRWMPLWFNTANDKILTTSSSIEIPAVV